MIDFSSIWNDLVNLGFNHFEKPLFLLLIIFAIIFIILFIRRDFVRLHTSKETEVKRRKLRIYVLISRIVIVSLLLIALASPFVEDIRTVRGDPNVKILVDNSTSMELFNLDIVNALQENLAKRLPVEVHYIGDKEESRLGDDILSNMRKGDNLLLITDGNNNEGLELGDVALQANFINSSINGIRLIPEKFDSSIVILGPAKTTSNVENEFTVYIKRTYPQTIRVQVYVDGNSVFDGETDQSEINFKKSFGDGYHKISARIASPDYFGENNVFYKVVKVVPKPKVLLVSSNYELEQLFSPLYELTRIVNLTSDYEPYTAIIIDDVPAEELNDKTDLLVNYLAEGNGLLAVGGKNSYDFGYYNNSRFEQLLPVFVSKAGRKKGQVNIVFLMDISLSTGEGFGNYSKVDVEKALALNMLNNVSYSHNVGFIAFNSLAYNLADLQPLANHVDLGEKITSLRFIGGTDIANGLLAAVDMLQNTGGSKNIILISDGMDNLGPNRVYDAADYAISQGIRVYTVGVGRDTNREVMQAIASRTAATYFEPDTTQRINVLFGETEISGDKKVFPLTIIDGNHFITRGLDLTAKLYGFNQVVPKNSAKMLITTDVGDPILTIWRFGLGRVVSLSTGIQTFGYELLNQENSILFTRATNWAVGDPERKNKRFIDIPDGRVNESIEVTVKSDIQPSSDEIALYKVDDELYQGTISLAEVGFSRLLDAEFAVNNKREYQDIGFNPNFENVVSTTGGRMFNADEVDNIVEFIKQRSRREVFVNKSYSWILLIFALILYLIEVIIRRLVSYKVL